MFLEGQRSTRSQMSTAMTITNWSKNIIDFNQKRNEDEEGEKEPGSRLINTKYEAKV